jgi:hypothetical protein
MMIKNNNNNNKNWEARIRGLHHVSVALFSSIICINCEMYADNYDKLPAFASSSFQVLCS